MHPRDISIFDLTYDLPPDRIAQQPLAQRDASKLLIYRDGWIEDGIFRELPDLLPQNSLLIMNNTRVVNARIVMQRKTGGRIEILITEPADGTPIESNFHRTGSCTWRAMIGNGRRWRSGETLSIAMDDLIVEADRLDHEIVRFRWSPDAITFAEVLRRIGHVPLPPYMTRPDEKTDQERYNTVIAKHDGSIAAPTASLHFTAEMLSRFQDRKIQKAEVTLHVGAGTFLPVKADRMSGHEMHREQVRIPLGTLIAIKDQLGKAPIVPIGTTALRTIESIYWYGLKILNGTAEDEMDIDQWEPYGSVDQKPSAIDAIEAVIDHTRSKGKDQCVGSTRLLIAPGYDFRYADGLVTNFHQPQSTLLLLVAALVGDDWRRIYDHARNGGYRFLSYGDGSLLWKKKR